MTNEINFLKYTKSKLLSSFISVLFLILVPKLFSQYLKLSDVNLTTILFVVWNIMSIIIIINLYNNLVYKNILISKIEHKPLIIKIHNILSILLRYLLILLISSLIWITLIQLLTYVNINTNVIIIAQLSQLSNFIIDLFSSISELLFVIVYIYDFVIVIFRNQIFI